MSIYSGNNYRKVYENYHGPIPKDQDGRSYEIHHIDGNHFNNSIDNLQALTIREHYDIHYSQGDWGACLRIGERMKISHEELSRLASLTALKRVADGTHNFLDGKKQSERALKRVAAGTHHLLGGENARKRVADGTHHFLGSTLNNKRIADGTHNFLNSEKQRETALKRVANGTNPFLGGKIQGESSRKRVANGTHPFQHPPSWKCEHCNKEGKGTANYNRYHGKNCINRIKIISDQ
jgi:hypothetical protein